MPTINIHVHENDQPNGEKAGTFTQPHPKVRVQNGDSVNWHVLNPGVTNFEVRFAGLTSPFQTGAFSITDENPRPTTNQARLYHYSVSVTIGGQSYSIQDCPELDVT